MQGIVSYFSSGVAEFQSVYSVCSAENLYAHTKENHKFFKNKTHFRLFFHNLVKNISGYYPIAPSTYNYTHPLYALPHGERYREGVYFACVNARGIPGSDCRRTPQALSCLPFGEVGGAFYLAFASVIVDSVSNLNNDYYIWPVYLLRGIRAFLLSAKPINYPLYH